MERYDVMIVGAGSAGCVLAARLSKNPNRKVLLLEAGPHFKTLDSFPKELKYGGILSSMAPDHPNNWAFAATLRPGVEQIVPRGKVVGGSSALNGTLFTRGLPEDFNGWAVAGNHEWSFDKVLPYFRKLETDLDIHDDFHGSSGPIPVRRAKRDEWPPVAHAFLQACLDAGFPEDPDMNGPKSTFVNGELRQHSNTRNLVFNCYVQIETLWTAFTLLPGTVISTGTPSGVGAVMNPPRFLKPGDIVRVEIERIGHIDNRVIDEPADSVFD